LWRPDSLASRWTDESPPQLRPRKGPGPNWPLRVGAFLLYGLTPHATLYAETPASMLPSSPEREADTTGKADADAPELPIIITSFRGDRIANPGEEEQAWPSPPPIGSVDRTAAPRRWTDHVASDQYDTIGSRIGRIKWETAGVFAFYTVINAPKFSKPMKPFHFKSEGWFGDNTDSLGVDKLAHAWDSYMISELLHARLHKKTGGAAGDATTAALIAMGAMIYSELYDGIETTSGFSFEDIAMNTSGVIFSVIRNTVPGVKEKLDFRLLLTPNSNIYTRTGRDHWAQQQYLLALKLSGFSRFENSPLRFVELHTGYRVSNFTHDAVARGETPKGHVFFGVGINLRELFFKDSRSTVGRAAGTALDYLQVPYTAIHHDY
jgi:hypothetical protein